LSFAFAPVLTQVAARFEIEPVVAGLLLIGIFPLIFALLSVPAGSVADRYGYRSAIFLGAGLTTAGAIALTFDTSLPALSLGQLAVAIAQPFLFNAMPRLVADWFPGTLQRTAMGLATSGFYLGLAIGLGATAPLLTWLGFSGTMLLFAVVTFGAFIAGLLLIRPNSQRIATTPQSTSFSLSKEQIDGNRLLYAMGFFLVGYYNGLLTWLESLLLRVGIDGQTAGISGSAFVLAGIVGSGLIPNLADRQKNSQRWLRICALATVLLTIPVLWGASPALVIFAAAPLGFCFLPMAALAIEALSANTGEASAASATARFMLIGNTGAIASTVSMGMIGSTSANFEAAAWLLMLLAVAGALTVFRVRNI
jgi:cyanate permease